jgi:menaquinone-dependent protoporphyrinogen oxidase
MMTNILIAYASKYGSTKEIAERIGLILEREGFGVDVKDAATVSSLGPYQGVVVGSALYFDTWLPSASELLDSFQDELAKKNVWLFSSGITGEGDFSKMIEWSFPESLRPLLKAIQPKAIALFGGRVNAKNLELDDWLVNPGVRVHSSDYRNWLDIEAWAKTIAVALRPSGTPTQPLRKESFMRTIPYYTSEDAKRVGEVLKIDWQRIDLEQFRHGMDVELEHGRENPLTDVTHDDAVATGKIALAHLNEFPDYYTRLEKMEDEAIKFWHEKTEVSRKAFTLVTDS